MSSGNRREMTVDQTLRLAINGHLTDDIRVRASLSDDNLPVVPEGNTEQLRDVDQIRVELDAERWRAVLGDFVAVREGFALGGYRRKLQGLTLAAAGATRGVDILAGSPRGDYRTVQLRGQEANQGPYFLGAGDAGEELFIVAGSERVRLDGSPLTRGSDKDYVIDYVRGTVTFTYRNLITADSEITVEFEQGEGPYARTVAGGGGWGEFHLPGIAAPGTLTVRVIREKDDPDRLRSGELSAENRDILAAAGDDPDAALADGVVEREPGEGSYRRGVIDGLEIWIHDPQAGDHDVYFNYVGPGAGDYGVDSLTVAGEVVYGWRGSGSGAYRVGQPLAVPVSQSLAGAVLRFGAVEGAGAGVTLEGDLTTMDRNILSGFDDGLAGRAAVDIGSGRPRLLGAGLGEAGLTLKHEQRDARFRPFLLRRDIFAYDRWGLGDRSRRTGFLDQRDAESEVAATLVREGRTGAYDLQAQWGRLRHGENLEAERRDLRGKWRLGSLRGETTWGEATGEDELDPLDVFRKHQDHRIVLAAGPAQPSVGYAREQYADDAAADSTGGGYRTRAWRAGLAAAPLRAFDWKLGFVRQRADSLRGGSWKQERDSRTGTIHLGTPAWAGMRLTADATIREVKVPGGADRRTRLAKAYLSGAWPGMGSDWSLQYGVDNSRTEVLDRQVVFVGERQGDYNQDGDFVGRNLGDYNVRTVGTDSLVATTEVTADLAWRQDFARLGRDRLWGAWNTYTRLSVRSRSRDPDETRLMRFEPGSIFDPDFTVLGEVTLRQEVQLLRHLRRWDLRLNYDFDQALDKQYATRPEDRLGRSYEVSLTVGLNSRLNLRLRGVLDDEKRMTAESGGSNRSYDSRTRRAESELSWRPGANNRLALAGEFITREDEVTGVSQDELAIGPSARIKVARRWTALVNLRLATVDGDEPAAVVRPYFYSIPGANHEITARLGWDPTSRLSASLSWFGRRRGEGGWQHDVRLESTARF